MYASLCPLADGCRLSSLATNGKVIKLAGIRASNRISHTAIDPERGSASTRDYSKLELQPLFGMGKYFWSSEL